MASEAPDATATPTETDDGLRELDVRAGLGLFASATQLDHLLAISRQLEVPAGHVLFERDASVDTLFQVISGDLEMRAPGLATWRVAEAGTAGFVDFMRARPHTRQAVAISAARLLELDAAEYSDYLEDNFQVSQRIMAQLSAGITADLIANPELHELLSSPSASGSRSFAGLEKVPVVDRLVMLSRMTAFRGASMQGLASLAQSAVETRYAPGEVIAAAGSRPSLVSLLVDGEIQLELPTGVRVMRRARDFVAHVEELATAPRLNIVIAATPAIVLQIEREELLDRIEEHFDLAMTIFAFIAAEQEKLNDYAATAEVALATDWK